MVNLDFASAAVEAGVRKTLTYHKDRSAGAPVKLELGDDELNEVVPGVRFGTSRRHSISSRPMRSRFQGTYIERALCY